MRRSSPSFARPRFLFLAAALAGGCGPPGGAHPPEPAAQGEDEAPRDPPGARREMLETLRQADAAPRGPADGGGRAWLETADGGPARAVAGQPGTWTIVYEAGAAGIAAGGFLRLTVPPFWGWSPAQIRFPDAPGYTTAAPEAPGVELETAAADWLDIVVRGRALAAGERIRIVYGAGRAGAMADRFAERGSRFWIGVDGDGDGVAGTLVDSPAVSVAPGPPALLRLLAPSTARPGEEIVLRAVVLDRLGNRGAAFAGELSLETPGEGLALPAAVPFDPAAGGILAIPVAVQAPGVYRVMGTVRAAGATEDAEPLFSALSNPLLAAEASAPIRWADLHGHSNLSDGTGTPDDYFAYARDVAGLDVAALTDHDHWGMLALDRYPELWEEIRAAVEHHHAPGSFVTLLGYEWTSWLHGHRHVLFFADEGEVLSSIDPAFETPAQLWAGLRGRRALTLAHHSAGGPIPTNWAFPPDPELEPMTEIVSVHGCSEAPDAPRLIYRPWTDNFVRDALDRGYRLGFVGSGDSHDGHPGHADIAAGPQGTGLAAILTEDLTREGVYDALRARRAYATNGPRIVLRTALGGRRMGEVVPRPAEGGKATLYVRVIPEAPLAYVDVVRRTGVARHEVPPETWHFEATLELEDLAAGEYVYVRAVQVDEGAAWSSPFFVE
ncbi:MAG: CehA/McbA family metallohydrolase [Planctomycetota bacterium]